MGGQRKTTAKCRGPLYGGNKWLLRSLITIRGYSFLCFKKARSTSRKQKCTATVRKKCLKVVTNEKGEALGEILTIIC